MIIRGATLVSRLAVIFAVLFTFTACGGGGGGGDAFFQGSNDAKIQLTLLDPQGNDTRTITSASPGTLRVTIKDNGANVVVSAQTDIGTLFPASGTALTDGSGTATFQIEAGDEKGGGTITATATTEDGELTGFLDFQVGDSGLLMGYFDTDGEFIENAIYIEPQSTLAAGGNAQFSVVVLDSSGNRVATAEEVRFNSGCIAAGLATINPVVPTTVNGEASTLYTAQGCAGTDEITASLVGAGTQAFGTISIASRQTNAVNFVSAEPLLIVLRGTGGQNRDETSDIVFKVVDGTGRPLPGVSVQFSLSTYIGGLALSKTSALSDGNGEVTVTVQAGDVATVARVLASVTDSNGDLISTVSDLLTVTTGLPDQNSISLAVGDCGGDGSFVVDAAWTTDGLCRTLTVSMADKFNNPVVDGTAAIFTTEYGAIVGSCTTTDGTCSVEWRSQEPRIPTLTGFNYIVSFEDNQGTSCSAYHNHFNAIPCPEDLGNIRGARSAILVHAIGEESFIDRNGNGVMDQDEQFLFENLPEAFLDNNEDTVFTPALSQCVASPTGSLECISGQEEIFIDFNSNETYDLNNDPAVYNGLLCPVEGNGVWCSRELVNVRASHVITLGDAPRFQFLLVNGRSVVAGTTYANDAIPLNTPLALYIADTFNNPPPGGARVSLTTEGACEVATAIATDVFNQDRSGAFDWGLTVVPTTSTEPGYLTVTLTTPTVTTSEKYPCDVPVDPCDGASPLPPECN